ncbi:hypothetical protein BKA62DRAFT_714455 [Auriculariales sp. MPI-PUGE-AT-0066]|nr:hypothetical protein BKA62DRAFT_714455 [Auriculariales sp. MPI-PUGE-AT-0066]
MSSTSGGSRYGQAVSGVIFSFTGAYVWEVFSTLDFDLQYIKGKRRFTLAAVVYFVARYLLLVCYALAIYMTNVWDEHVNCNLSAYFSASMASALLILRVRALSERNPFVTGFLSATYAAGWGLMIWQTTRAQSVYIPRAHSCSIRGTTIIKVTTSLTFAYDSICLVLMLYYIKKSDNTRSEGFWKLLCDQGFVYMIVIVGVYAVAVTVSLLDLNSSISLGVGMFALFTLVTCATRLHRQIIVYNERSSSVFALHSRPAILHQNTSISMPMFASSYMGTSEDDAYPKTGSGSRCTCARV